MAGCQQKRKVYWQTAYFFLAAAAAGAAFLAGGGVGAAATTATVSFFRARVTPKEPIAILPRFDFLSPLPMVSVEKTVCCTLLIVAN